MGSCWSAPWIFQWGSRGQRHLPNPPLLDRIHKYDGEVLVIGAGASGLAAARILEKNGIRYSVLEATDRFGGRIKEDTTFADFPVDVGAEWIHNLPAVLDAMSGVPGEGEKSNLDRYWTTDRSTWNGRRLTKSSSLWQGFHWVFPEYRFKRSTWYDFIRRHLAENVRDRITFQAPVTKIDYAGSRVVVTTAGGQRYEADKVIVTASVGVLRSGSIAFAPALPEEKTKALDKIHFHKGFKMFLKFSTKFYPDVIAEWPKEGEKNFFDEALGKGAKDHVLCLLATGAGAEPYYKFDSEDAMVKAALAELDQMYDGEATRSFTGDYVVEDWGRKEFTKGTWVEGFMIPKKTVASLARSLDEKVFFAGEALDTYQQMGVPGAVLSGYKAVDDMFVPQAAEGVAWARRQ